MSAEINIERRPLSDNAQSIKFCKSAGLEISGVVEQGRAREPVLLLQKAV